MPEHIDQALVKLKLKSEHGPWSLNTVRLRVAGLVGAHRAAGLRSPRKALDLFPTEKMLREKHAKDLASCPVILNVEDVRRMIEVCEGDLRGIRDRALIAFIFASGGRRRSEVAAATVESIRETPAGDYIYALPRSGTSHASEPESRERPCSVDEKPLVGIAAEYLRIWLRAAGITAGPIWRRIRTNQKVGKRTLYHGSINAIVAKRAAQAGVRGRVTAHSLRAGFICEANRRKCPYSEIMDLAGLISLRQFETGSPYHQRTPNSNSEAATLLTVSSGD